MPKVSIIISVYNGEKFLCECLNSVINQTLKDVEIVCVNDGSEDNSLNILKEFAEKDSRIIIINQKNQGLASSRNNALQIIKGEYFQFVDADDRLRLDACEIIYNKCKKLNLDMLSFGGNNFNHITGKEDFNEFYNFTYLPEDWNKEVFSYKDAKDFLAKMAVSSCLTIYKKALIDKHNIIFPAGLCFEDNVFFLKALINAEKIGIEKTRLYQRRVHPESITQNMDKHFLDMIEISRIVLNYLKEINIDPDIYDCYAQKYLFGCKFFYHSLRKKVRQKYREPLTILLKDFGYPSVLEYSFVERIFSIKNELSRNRKMYKIITILGLKFSIRNKRKEKKLEYGVNK